MAEPISDEMRQKHSLHESCDCSNGPYTFPHCSVCGGFYPCDVINLCDAFDAANREIGRLTAMMERDGGAIPREFGKPLRVAGVLDGFRLFFGTTDIKAAKRRLGNAATRDEAIMFICADVVIAALDKEEKA
jgi:hypothetical protein